MTPLPCSSLIKTQRQFVARLAVTLLVNVFSLAASAQTPPANDNFTNRTVLSGSYIVVTNNNTFATQEAGEPTPPSCDRVGKTLWFSYTASEDGLLRIGGGGINGARAAWAVYEGDSLPTLALIGASCTEHVWFQAVSNHTYNIVVDGAFFTSGDVLLQIIFDARPPNDAFTNSVYLVGTNATATGDTIAATMEPGEPQSAEPATVWYSWVAPITGRAVLGGSIRDWAVFTGNQVDALIPVPMQPHFLAVEGTTYRFQIKTVQGAYFRGPFTLELVASPFVPPPNDYFTNASGLAGRGFGDTRAISEATQELGEPEFAGGIPCKSLWWHWQSPLSGPLVLNGWVGTVSETVYDLYAGDTIDDLTKVATATNQLRGTVVAGTSYYLRAAVPTNVIGDVSFYTAGPIAETASREVVGNLLAEPSFEGTGGNLTNWTGTGYDAAVDQYNGADGKTWIRLAPGGTLSQDVATVPGRDYRVRFAFANGTQMQILWDDQVLATVSAGGFWQWTNLVVVATQSLSRLTFTNIGATLDLDATSVIWNSEPPSILTQPLSASVPLGGAVAFNVFARGGAPLAYHWRFNGAPIPAPKVNPLILTGLGVQAAGEYSVVVSNSFGTVTSSNATLIVDTSAPPAIVLQPESDVIPVGVYHVLTAAAIGAPPLSYQWMKDGVSLDGATNSRIIFTNLQAEHAGQYFLRVTNSAGTAQTLPATLIVTNVVSGNGVVNFSTRASFPAASAVNAPVFDVDNITRLSGTNFVGQLYVGPSIDSLRAVGQPRPFSSGLGVGHVVDPNPVVIPTVPAGTQAVIQLRAWQASFGASYEEARALGGKFGKSPTFTIIPLAGLAAVPPNLVGLQSFHLRAGLAQFVSGRVSIALGNDPGEVQVSVLGEPDSRYLIERSTNRFDWFPLTVITNITGTATFDDTPSAESAFYRARLLD